MSFTTTTLPGFAWISKMHSSCLWLYQKMLYLGGGGAELVVIVTRGERVSFPLS